MDKLTYKICPTLTINDGYPAISGAVDVYQDGVQIDSIPVEGKIKGVKDRVDKRVKQLKHKEAKEKKWKDQSK